MKQKFWWVLSLLVLLGAGTGAQAPGAEVKATVYVFLADTCPISQTATLTLRELHAAYAGRGIRFVGLFPDAQTRPADIILFGKRYKVPFPLRSDEKQRLARRFQARITPEVVVAAADDQTVLYQGRIDDSYVRLGQRRLVTGHQELRDALAAIVAGRPVPVARTEAVGCYISFLSPLQR
ncbi:redoxin domain-containing protein [Hymenobacter persicinus]|nr:redoxin domain-containing protein [Hymenobacter persicinus]